MVDRINSSIEPYLHLNGDNYGVVRKRAHSKAYHDELARATGMKFTHARALKQARGVAMAAIKIWETKVVE